MLPFLDFLRVFLAVYIGACAVKNSFGIRFRLLFLFGSLPETLCLIFLSSLQLGFLFLGSLVGVLARSSSAVVFIAVVGEKAVARGVSNLGFCLPFHFFFLGEVLARRHGSGKMILDYG